MNDDLTHSFIIRGEHYTITRSQILDATRYKRPDLGGVKPGSRYVVLRRRRVPVKWALRQALGIPGKGFQTQEAEAIMRNLGFTTGQEPLDAEATR